MDPIPDAHAPGPARWELLSHQTFPQSLNTLHLHLLSSNLLNRSAKFVLNIIRFIIFIEMASSPPISPKVATPLAHRKRRHSVMERNGAVPACDGDDSLNQGADSLILRPKISNSDVSTTVQNGSSATAAVVRKLEDDSDIDDDDKELFEDILDTAELEPYRPGNLACNHPSMALLTIFPQASSMAKKMVWIRRLPLNSAIVCCKSVLKHSFMRRSQLPRCLQRF